jgi:hypothetical protein
MAVSTLTPLAFASRRELTKAYLRLTADIGLVSSSVAALLGVWAPEAGYTNTISQVGTSPALTLIANRHYRLELWPYTTAVDANEYDFWEWRTTAGIALPATAMGGAAYSSAAGREEMGACVVAHVLSPTNIDVTVWTSSISGAKTLSAESASRSTSIFVYELPVWAF